MTSQSRDLAFWAQVAMLPMMVESPLRLGFFHDKNRAFWILQGGGWFAYLLLRALSGLANSMGLAFVLPAVIVTATGFSITLLH